MVDRVSRPVVPLTHANEIEHRRMLAQRASACLPKDGTEAMTGPLPLQPVATADLPDATLYEGAVMYDTTLSLLAYSNGTSWSYFPPTYLAGTFSPTYVTSGTQFTSVTYQGNRFGRYTRIGREVHFRLRIQTDAITIGAATGNLIVGGLPFTSADLSGTTAGYQAVCVSFRSNFAATPPISGNVFEVGSGIELYHLTTTLAAHATCPAATTVGTGAGANLLYIGGSYQVTD